MFEQRLQYLKSAISADEFDGQDDSNNIPSPCWNRSPKLQALEWYSRMIFRGPLCSEWRQSLSSSSSVPSFSALERLFDTFRFNFNFLNTRLPLSNAEMIEAIMEQTVTGGVEDILANRHGLVQALIAAGMPPELVGMRISEKQMRKRNQEGAFRLSRPVHGHHMLFAQCCRESTQIVKYYSRSWSNSPHPPQA